MTSALDRTSFRGGVRVPFGRPVGRSGFLHVMSSVPSSQDEVGYLRSVRYWPLALWFLLCGTISLTRFLLDPTSFRGGVCVPFIGRRREMLKVCQYRSRRM